MNWPFPRRRPDALPWPSWAAEPRHYPRAGRFELAALLALTLLWCWQCQQWLAGVVLAGSLALGLAFDEGFTVNRRWHRRSGFMCFFFAAGLSFWAFADKADFADGAFWPLIGMLPIIFAPRLLLLAWGRREIPSLSAARDGANLARLMADAERLGERATLARLTERGLDQEGPDGPSAGFWPALALALAIASSSELGGAFACVAFGAWFLGRAADRDRGRRGASARSGAASRAALLLGIAVGCGLGALGLRFAEAFADHAVWAVASSRWSSAGWSTSMFRASIGRTGTLNLPGSLIWRVKTTPPRPPGDAFLLRMALFNLTADGAVWTSKPADLSSSRGEPVLRGKNSVVALPDAQPPAPGGARVRYELSGSISRPNWPLPLPSGSFLVGGLAASDLSLSPLGSLSARHPMGFSQFFVDAAPRENFQPEPGPMDLGVPSGLAPLLAKKDQEIGLDANHPDQDAQRLRAYFSGYRYTLSMDGGRTLAAFLTTQREGHCEYFASATVLLLRQAGVPARMATGFLAHEYDPKEQQWWVRTRDAHAWASYWNGQSWVDLDTTPPGSSEGIPSASDDFWDSLARLQYGLLTLDLSDWAQALGISATQKRWIFGGLLALLALAADTLRERRRKSRGARPLNRQGREARRFFAELARFAGPGPMEETLSELAARAGSMPGGRSEWAALARRREASVFGSAPFDPALSGALRRANWRLLWLRARRAASRRGR
jgi:hypothetical protein